MKNNKGFSLVELIIVIAIMAILVGVMAPQLIKYIEKTNVSSDSQLCDSVKTAITTAMMDPTVINATNANIPTNSTFQAMSTIQAGAFKDSVEEILGFPISDLENHIKSNMTGGKASGIQFAIVNATSVHVQITNSDNTGKKGKNGAHPIYVD
ncbi:MAG: prepilin-type N-terminal cleavage/methylation domain-containing protein [Lachnospiraceae bacterium]|nr:prepilin-type N-terminal cleavage/methylation domain-containing protein [Lachnospiraceae bacterium]